MDGGPVIEPLTPVQCTLLLATTRHGRISMSLGALPVIRSVVFALTPGHVAFRVAPRSRLHSAAKGSVVAFQADHSGEPDGVGWSVLVQGVCEEVTDPGAVRDLLDLPLPSWHPEGDVFLRLPLDHVSGERVLW